MVVVVVIDSAYDLWMASLSMDNHAIHGWNMPLVVEHAIGSRTCHWW